MLTFTTSAASHSAEYTNDSAGGGASVAPAAIVIKTYSRCKITGDMGVEYEMITNPLRKGKMMTKEEAMQYVEKHGLVKAIEGKDGVVWDTPGREFQTKWKGCFNQSTTQY